MDLVQFLRARLDEDEAAARRAGDSFRQIGETGVIIATEGDRAEECASANWSGIAEHIVRHDPARVLAEVDAKRRVMKRHHDFQGWCAGCGNDLTYRINDCPELRDLASAYADHPEYRVEWKP